MGHLAAGAQGLSRPAVACAGPCSRPGFACLRVCLYALFNALTEQRWTLLERPWEVCLRGSGPAGCMARNVGCPAARVGREAPRWGPEVARA